MRREKKTRKGEKKSSFPYSHWYSCPTSYILSYLIVGGLSFPLFGFSLSTFSFSSKKGPKLSWPFRGSPGGIESSYHQRIIGPAQSQEIAAARKVSYVTMRKTTKKRSQAKSRVSSSRPFDSLKRKEKKEGKGRVYPRVGLGCLGWKDHHLTYDNIGCFPCCWCLSLSFLFFLLLVERMLCFVEENGAGGGPLEPCQLAFLVSTVEDNIYRGVSYKKGRKCSRYHHLLASMLVARRGEQSPLLC